MPKLNFRALTAASVCLMLLGLTAAGCKGGGGDPGVRADSPGSSGGLGGGLGGDAPFPGGGGGGGGGNGDGRGGGDDPGGGGDAPQVPNPPPGGGGGGGGGATSVSADIDASAGFATTTYNAQTDQLLRLTLNVTDATSFQIISQVASTTLATTSLTAPSGAEVVSVADDPPKTTAVGLDTLVNTLPYPTRGADPAVANGSYLQDLFVGRSTQVNGTVVAKRDATTNSGTLLANVFLVGTNAQSNNRSTIDSAIAIWRGVFSTMGIGLDVAFINVPSTTGVVPNPLAGSTFYQVQTAAGGVRPFALNVFIGDSISVDGGQDPNNVFPDVLGIASAIPGPAIPTAKSAVAVSLLLHSGPDGVFDADELRVFGETIAHESGHYLGLFHPVEINPSGGFFLEDPLADTPTCTTELNCSGTGVVGNVMFPRPIGDTPQQTLTPDQGRVLNLQVIVS